MMKRKEKKKEWWDEYGISQEGAEEILLPRNPHEWKHFHIGKTFSPRAKKIIIVGFIILIMVIIFGYLAPYWAITIAIITTLLMVGAKIFLVLNKKMKYEALNHFSYRQMFINILKEEGITKGN
jgi:hypothetical protein